MDDSWRTAYGQAKMELEEYKGTIVPALMDRIKELEEQEPEGCQGEGQAGRMNERGLRPPLFCGWRGAEDERRVGGMWKVVGGVMT